MKMPIDTQRDDVIEHLVGEERHRQEAVDAHTNYTPTALQRQVLRNVPVSTRRRMARRDQDTGVWHHHRSMVSRPGLASALTLSMLHPCAGEDDMICRFGKKISKSY